MKRTKITNVIHVVNFFFSIWKFAATHEGDKDHKCEYCGTLVKSLKKHIISIQFMKATKITSVKFVRNLLVHQEKKNFTSKGFMMT